MFKLTDELKGEHKQLVALLGKVSATGVGSEEGKKFLFSAKDGLMGHLNKEGEKLYPALRKAAETNSNLKSILDTFAKDMDEIGKEVNNFFGKYAVTSTSTMDFARDFGKVTSLLSVRIRREEEVLYAEYDKLKI